MPLIPNAMYVTVFAGCGLYGFFTVVSQTRKIRAARPYAGALYAWAEPPGMGFREDFPTWIALNTHRGTAILLGLVGLLMLIFQPIESVAPPEWPPLAAFLFGPLVVGIVGVIGFFFGFMVGGIVAEVSGSDRHYAVSDAGVLALGRVQPWDTLSHVSVDRAHGAVRIWSASLPGTIGFLFHPPASGWDSLLGVLRVHLPVREEPSLGAERYGFAVRMIILCGPFVLAAIVLYGMASAAALTAIAVLLWLLLWLGSVFIMRWVYGGKSRPADMEGANSTGEKHMEH